MTEDISRTGSLRRPDIYPLRIMGKRVVSPFELGGPDMAIIRRMRDQTPIVRITLFSELSEQDRTRGYRKFRRDLLLSLSKDGQALITMSGYLFTGDVKVTAWRDTVPPSNSPLYRIDSRTQQQIDTVRKVSLTHVQGLRAARSKHHQRVEGLDLVDLSVEAASEIHRAIVYSVPSS